MANKRVTTKSTTGATATAVAKPKPKKPSSKKVAPAKGAPAKSAAKSKGKSSAASKKSGTKTSSKKSAAGSKTALAREDTVEQIERMLRRKAGVTSFDTFGCIGESEEDYFVTPEPGETFGRCGGRVISSKMEKRVCDKLSDAGVAHCHRPRRYEVKVDEKVIAAYSPCIALRGRGREGKTAVLEVLASTDALHVKKLQAFRSLYESEFYVTLVAPGHVLDEIARDSFDEAVLPSELGSLVARLAE